MGHAGMTLDNFVQHEKSVLAQLDRVHVLVLRLYTSSSHKKFNYALRNEVQPHPWKLCVYWLSEALRQLRGVQAPEAFTKDEDLWRGMDDMSSHQPEFLFNGGTEMAVMSASAAREKAELYAGSINPLLFKLKTTGMTRGAQIDYLSLYPKEKEYTYPPMVFLKPANGPESSYQENGVTIIEVTPQF